MRLFTVLFLCFSSFQLFGQDKKAMDPSVYGMWNRISNVEISNDGNWVLYRLTSEDGDPVVKLFNRTSGKTKQFERGSKASFDKEATHLFFHTVASKDTIKTLKRKGKKSKDMPKDTLSIFNLSSQTLEQIPSIKSYASPEKWGGFVVYHLAPNNPEPDTSRTAPKIKKESKENGSKLLMRNLKTYKEDTLRYIVSYTTAEEAPILSAVTTGDDSLLLAGVLTQELKESTPHFVHQSEGKYKQLSLSKEGNHLAFLVNQDTTDALIAPYELFLYNTMDKRLTPLIDNQSEQIPDGHIVSGDRKPSWSYSDDILYFGISPTPVLQDTSLLDEEIVNVEVWHYQDQLLYTQQENRLKQEKKKSYRYQYDLKSKKITGLANANIQDVLISQRGTNEWIVGMDDDHYQKYVSWKGFDFFDLYKINAKSGEKKRIAEKLQGQSRRLSPSGRYLTWYSNVDTMWMLFDLENEKIRSITNNNIATFYNELHDQPSHPWAYGRAGWTPTEDRVLLYDRYDIWEIDPSAKVPPRRVTQGRETTTRHRFSQLDRDEPYLNIDQPMLMHLFNDTSKEHGYAWLKEGRTSMIKMGKKQLMTRPYKAKDAEVIVYSEEDFSTFPDLWASDFSFANPRKISNANPQIVDYRGGTVELIEYTGLNGDPHVGMLYTPEDLDPTKKYPMIVNFYEKSSDRLYRNRAPFAHRSTINYAYYLSKGYVIFNPDIHYKNGYPGQSCYNSVMPGVDKVLEKGFIDESRMGLQGHSWGGYQIADLLTRTNRFKCAESGAPVVNMISAYGGIRWGSGLSRMFQYERTQSRLGATLWDNKDLFLENSPIFNMDKVNTPVLILHNDEDGAVPWYQGIEYFVAMRRLGKPAWLLNYNKEPHWPVKWQNRKDFNIRMEQFFDHYLLGEPMPIWMKKGVPAIEKGINQGLELDR